MVRPDEMDCSLKVPKLMGLMLAGGSTVNLSMPAAQMSTRMQGIAFFTRPPVTETALTEAFDQDPKCRRSGRRKQLPPRELRREVGKP